MCNIWHTSIPPNLHFASPLAIQNQKQNESKKHKSAVVGEMIAFSVCNKPFEHPSTPTAQVKSHEGLMSADCCTFKPLNSHILIP